MGRAVRLGEQRLTPVWKLDGIGDEPPLLVPPTRLLAVAVLPIVVCTARPAVIDQLRGTRTGMSARLQGACAGRLSWRSMRRTMYSYPAPSKPEETRWSAPCLTNVALIEQANCGRHIVANSSIRINAQQLQVLQRLGKAYCVPR
jgi:hypothetical protein